MSIDIGTLSIIIVVAIGVLLITGLPFAFVTGAIACVAALVLWGPDSLTVIVSRVLGMMRGYVFVAAPMFILMAQVLRKSGVVEDLFTAVYVWLGPVRGGLAVATIAAATIMAAMTGIIGAAVVTLGLIALPEMLKRGYNKSIACGSVMAGGGLGTLIPPSIVFIMYGATAGVSVGKLFVAGVMPGLLLSAGYILYVLMRALINPKVAPSLPKEERRIPFKRKIALGKGLILPGILIILVLGSIYGGLATPTEAAGAGAAGAFFCAAVHRRLNWSLVKDALLDTVEITCMMLWLAFGALGLVSVYALAGGTQFVTDLIYELPLGPLGIVIVMMLILIVLGTMLDWLGILFLTMPLFVPIIVELGFDPIWFGVLFVMNIQMAYLTPPFGQGMFYLKGVAPPSISMADVIRSIWAFLGIQLIALTIVLFNPQIALWLPGKMLGE